MNFIGTAAPLTANGIASAAASLGVSASHIWAILAVESVGFGFLPDRRPKILVERHIFHRRTQGRFTGPGRSNISHPEPGGYLGGAREYDRLTAAMALDETAALESASWGLPQAMGFNALLCGYPDARAMVAAFTASEDAQLAAMASFIRANPAMHNALRANRWAAFAEAYNGKGYRKNRYDEKLAAAFAVALKQSPDLDLRAAQAALTFLGFDPGPVDGLPGRKTAAAIADFQRARGLAATGILDDATASKISAAAFPAPRPAPRPSFLSRILSALSKR